MRLTEETFKAGMAGLGLVYDRDVTSSELNGTYWLALYEYPDEAVKRAFTQVLKTCKWFPRVADLVEAIEGARKNMGKLAWAELKTMLGTWGGMWNHVWHTDGATAEAVKVIGGWSVLSGLRPYDLNQQEDVFLAAYERAVAAGIQHRLGKIVGKRDIDWQTNEVKPLTVISHGEQRAVTFGGAPEGEGTDHVLVLPGEVEQKMADMMIAKKMN